MYSRGGVSCFSPLFFKSVAPDGCVHILRKKSTAPVRLGQGAVGFDEGVSYLTMRRATLPSE